MVKEIREKINSLGIIYFNKLNKIKKSEVRGAGVNDVCI